MNYRHSDGPRNRRAAARGARHRELIRQILLQHVERTPLGRPLTAKQVQELLGRRGIALGLSTVGWHIAHVRLEDELRSLEVEAGSIGGEHRLG